MSSTRDPLHQFLSGMEYPAEKFDLVFEASKEGRGADVVDRLRMLPEGSYDGPHAVRRALTRIELTTSGMTRIDAVA
ncbi:hypothetical protein GCM10027416_05770 [Okibacterium endophyticum]